MYIDDYLLFDICLLITLIINICALDYINTAIGIKMFALKCTKEI